MTKKHLLYIISTLAIVLLVPVLASNVAEAKKHVSKTTSKKSDAKDKESKPDNSSVDITTRRSDKDKNLDKLKEKLYPEDKSAKDKPKTEKPKTDAKAKDSTPAPQSPDNNTIVKNLINMKSDELEKVKQNQLSRIRTDNTIEKQNKKKLLAETTKFYDTLKKLPPEERESFVNNFKK